jgi:hypothetical protein
MAEEVRRELDFDFRTTQSQMWFAENNLVESLNEKQKALYEIFCQKREEFYAIAKELYTRKF